MPPDEEVGPVQVDISELRREVGERKAFSFSGPLEDHFPAGISLAGPVEVKGTVRNTGPAYLVEGSIRAQVEAVCGRCLTPFHQVVEAPLREEFREGSPPPPGQDEISDDSGLEVWFFQGDMMDLSEAVRQNLILALPTQPLCRPDCPGLCPVCGRRLDQGSCDCRIQGVDPRLEALRRFLNPKE